MRQSRVVFYREEKTGGEGRWEMKKMQGTTSALGAEILSLRPACP
jgi:hypothetical protein